MKKKILFLVNHDIVIYNFRKEIVINLLEKGYEVIISSPNGERISYLKEMGCIHVPITIERHGTNPITDFRLILEYSKLIKNIKPDIILTFTIKPNIYGGIAAKRFHVPYIANITGLGQGIQKEGITQKLITLLYRKSFSKVNKVFFQNTENMNFFSKHNIASGRYQLLPGSGVNLEEFQIQEYPTGETIHFAYISRIMEQKGINEYLSAIKIVKEKYPLTQFHVCGFCEEEYEEQLKKLHEEGEIIYHGMITNVKEIYSFIHCLVHPSYHEGMSNVILEASASGVPTIASDIPGCREAVVNDITGYTFEVKNAEKLAERILHFIELPYDKRKRMGISAREKMKNEFDRQIVVDKYLEVIQKTLGDV
ncbi:glycosyltransferase family 4 protein [Enterococcus sp. LJL98]